MNMATLPSAGVVALSIAAMTSAYSYGQFRGESKPHEAIILQIATRVVALETVNVATAERLARIEERAIASGKSLDRIEILLTSKPPGTKR